MRLAVCLMILASICVAAAAQEIPVGKPADVPPSLGQATAARPPQTPRTDSVVEGTNGDIFLSSPPAGYGTAGVFIRANGTTYPDVLVRLGAGTAASSFSVFNAANTSLLRVQGDRSVLIGATAPAWAARLTVEQGTAGTSVAGVRSAAVPANVNQTTYGSMFANYEGISSGVTNSGAAVGAYVISANTGAGTLASSIGSLTFSGASGTGTVSSAIGGQFSILGDAARVATGYAVMITDVQAASGFGVYQMAADDRNYFAGRVGIGTNPAVALDVVGDAQFTGTVTGGNIKAKYQDLAEWVPARGEMPAGTVVVLDGTRANTVTASTAAYDTAVAGVVSDRPGIILGEESPSAEQIATTGRVRVKVDASRAPIAIGDLLVTSNVPGHAMKSLPLDLAGVSVHRPGTIIGKALESLSGGTGEILVLLSLQ